MQSRTLNVLKGEWKFMGYSILYPSYEFEIQIMYRMQKMSLKPFNEVESTWNIKQQ